MTNRLWWKVSRRLGRNRRLEELETWYDGEYHGVSMQLGAPLPGEKNYGALHVGLCNREFREPNGAGYARVPLGSRLEPRGMFLHNIEPIQFPTACGSWGEVTHFFITTTRGSAYGKLSQPKTVIEGDTCSFGPGDLKIELIPNVGEATDHPNPFLLEG